MTAVRRAVLLLALAALAAGASGCASVWHELKPHRLQRLNRGPGMPTGPEAYSALVPTSGFA